MISEILICGYMDTEIITPRFIFSSKAALKEFIKHNENFFFKHVPPMKEFIEEWYVNEWASPSILAGIDLQHSPTTKHLSFGKWVKVKDYLNGEKTFG